MSSFEDNKNVARRARRRRAADTHTPHTRKFGHYSNFSAEERSVMSVCVGGLKSATACGCTPEVKLFMEFTGHCQ